MAFTTDISKTDDIVSEAIALQTRVDTLEQPLFVIESYRQLAATAQNINAAAGGNVQWDDTGYNRGTSEYSINGANEVVTITGTFDHVEINLNMHHIVADNVNATRAAPYVQVVRDNVYTRQHRP